MCSVWAQIRYTVVIHTQPRIYTTQEVPKDPLKQIDNV